MSKGYLINEYGKYVIDDYSLFMEDFFNTYTVVYSLQKNLYYLYDDSTGIYFEWSEILQKQTIKEYLDLIDTSMWTPKLERQILSAIPANVSVVAKMDCKKNILTLSNGVLNLKTLQLVKFSKKNLSTWRLNIAYNPYAKSPRYDKFIEEISCGDETMMLSLNEIMGYVLDESIKAHKLFIFCGDGSNGKSLFCDILSAMLADKNVSNIPITELNQKAFSRHFISDKRVNIVYENDTKMKLSQLFSGITKSIVTGDKINAEIKGGANYSFTSHLKMIIATNVLPEIDTIPNTAVTRRYLIIPFSAYFGPEKADKNLFSTLQKEAEGILIRAIEGMKRLQEQDYVFSYQKKSDKYLMHMVNDAFPVVGFVNEKIVVNPKGKVLYSDLRKAYSEYCNEKGAYEIYIGNEFPVQVKKILRDRNVRVEPLKSNGDRGLRGIQLKK
ncbi:MAG: hypothetical protein E7261_10970 [Lachnospiraceae bacterium]|nr:hypothetical protein [Lachnospiraceae bacterium]